jgi:hypothetical protein
MANYNKATNFASKDGLPSGNPSKIVKGTEIDTEFTAISSAISSKSDINSPAFTGTPTTPTAIPESNSTQIASTAFVKTAIASSGGSLGTMATQNANAVAITGGTITGSYGLTAANATNAVNATTASNPASGGSFITSSNIGSQSVNYANSAGNGGVTSIVAGSNITISGSTGAVTISSTGGGGGSFVGARSQLFTSSGTFTVPAGVTAVKVLLCGGGGGGGGSSDYQPYPGGQGGQGGTTSFGSFVTQTGAAGGQGAKQPYPPAMGGINGGSPGAIFQTADTYTNAAQTFRYGGNGLGGISYGNNQPTDGADGWITFLSISYLTGLTPGSNIAVTVGGGGSGGAKGGYYAPNENDGGAGLAGVLLVEW